VEQKKNSTQTVTLNRIVVPAHLRIVPLDAANAAKAASLQPPDGRDPAPQADAPRKSGAAAQAKPRSTSPLQPVPGSSAPAPLDEAVDEPEVIRGFDPYAKVAPPEVGNSKLKRLGYAALSLVAVVVVLLSMGGERPSGAPVAGLGGSAADEDLPLEAVQPTSAAPLPVAPAPVVAAPALAVAATAAAPAAAPVPALPLPDVPQRDLPVPAEPAPLDLDRTGIAAVTVSPTPVPRPVSVPAPAPAPAPEPEPEPEAAAALITPAPVVAPQPQPAVPGAADPVLLTPTPRATTAPAPERAPEFAAAPQPLRALVALPPAPEPEVVTSDAPRIAVSASDFVNQAALGTLNALRAPSASPSDTADGDLFGFVRSLQPERRSQAQIASMLQRAYDAGTLQIPPKFLLPDGGVDVATLLRAMAQAQ
jgi:hypothetical protein